MLDIKGEWTLITGASSGIGYEMAKILSGKGHNLVLVSRNEELLCQVARELNEISDIIVMPYDLSTPNAANAIHQECRRLGLRVDTLINNAGFGKFGENMDLDVQTVESMLGLNITTLTSMCNLFSKDMKEKGRGTILNVASTAAFAPIPYLSAYAASKTYVKYFSQALREELKNYNIRVTCMLPGATSTRFHEVAFNERDQKLFFRQPLMSAREVAEAGIEAMEKGKRTVVPGPFNRMVRLTAGLIPSSTLASLIRYLANQQN